MSNEQNTPRSRADVNKYGDLIVELNQVKAENKSLKRKVNLSEKDVINIALDFFEHFRVLHKKHGVIDVLESVQFVKDKIKEYSTTNQQEEQK